MDALLLHPSNYFRAADFAVPRQLVIAGLGMEQMPDGVKKPALSLVGESQKLVLNKTNTQLLIAAFGRETNNWAGRAIECHAEKVPMQGRIVDSIRLRPGQQAQPQQAPQPTVPIAQPLQADPQAPLN